MRNRGKWYNAVVSEASPTVKIYSTSWCVYCRMVKEYLARQGVPYVEINIEKDQKAAEYIMGKSHSAGVPQIEIGDEVILGFDRPRINSALAKYKLA